MRQCHIVLVYEGQSTLKLGYIRHLADTLQLKNLHKIQIFEKLLSAVGACRIL